MTRSELTTQMQSGRTFEDRLALLLSYLNDREVQSLLFFGHLPITEITPEERIASRLLETE